jgi:hypothetical protein
LFDSSCTPTWYSGSNRWGVGLISFAPGLSADLDDFVGRHE